jgi:AcrR family transcriptional regulator
MAYRQGLDKLVVLKAAAELADQVGLERLTLSALSERLNVKTPSLYNHIKGLPGLRRDLALYGFMQLKEALTGSALGKSGDEAVIAAATAYVAFVRRHPGLYEATLRAPDMSDPEIQEASSANVSIMLRILEDYRLEPEEALHTVRAFRSMVHGFASLEERQGFRMQLDRDMTLNHMLATYLRGLRR